MVIGSQVQAQPLYGLKSSVDQVNWDLHRTVPSGTTIYLKYFVSPPSGMGNNPVTFEWFVDGNSVGYQGSTNFFTVGYPCTHLYEAVGYNASGAIVQPKTGVHITYLAANSVGGLRTVGSLGEVTTDYHYLFEKRVYDNPLPALGTEKITGAYWWKSNPLAQNPQLPMLTCSQPNFQITGINLSEYATNQIGFFTEDGTVLDTIVFNFNIWTWSDYLQTWQWTATSLVEMRVIFHRDFFGCSWEIKP